MTNSFSDWSKTYIPVIIGQKKNRKRVKLRKQQRQQSCSDYNLLNFIAKYILCFFGLFNYYLNFTNTLTGIQAYIFCYLIHTYHIFNIVCFKVVGYIFYVFFNALFRFTFPIATNYVASDIYCVYTAVFYYLYFLFLYISQVLYEDVIFMVKISINFILYLCYLYISFVKLFNIGWFKYLVSLFNQSIYAIIQFLLSSNMFWIITTVIDFLYFRYYMINSIDYGIYNIRVKIQSINVHTRFYYGSNSTLNDLHYFIEEKLKENNILCGYNIFHTRVDLNTQKRFHITLKEFDINPNFILVVPNNALLKGGGKFDKENIPPKNRKRIIELNTERVKKFRKKNHKKIKKLKKGKESYKSFFIDDDFDEDKYPVHYLGKMNKECTKCGALMFEGECFRGNNKIFTLCCGDGKVTLPKLKKLPDKLIEYLTMNTEEAVYFRKNIRQINSALCFASMGCNDKSLAYGTFKIQGQICHRMEETFSKGAQFASIYFFDTDNELENRMNFGYMPKGTIGEKVIRELQTIIHELNPFYKVFKNAIERTLNEKIPQLQIVLQQHVNPVKYHKGKLIY